MSKKRKIVLFGAVLLILVLIVGSVYYYSKLQKERSQISEYFQDKEGIAALSDVISEQEKVSSDIQNILNSGEYTFDNPYVLVDPYGLSPLTALIIFQTSSEEEVEVVINGESVTTMESSKIHSIPIYGLRAGIENRILLKMNGREKEVVIDRKDVELDNLEVEVPNEKIKLSDELYFLSISDGDGAAAYDGHGNIVWNLSADYSLDIEFLKNGHIYLNNDNSSGLLESYEGFYELDYFGKIHKSYSLENGYHHELIALNDGTVIVVGASQSEVPSYVGTFVYQLNLENGEILNSFDVYDIFAKIDEDFANQLMGKNIQLNSVSYNEDTKDMILSLRGINSIVSLNFETKELHWIFGDANFYSEKFQKYMLHVSDNSRYPKGQHTVTLSEDGYLSVFNNDFDQVNSTSEDMMYYLNNYSSATIYKIDGMNVSTVWNYDGNQQYFSYELGSFYTYEDRSKLINFGWTFYPDIYSPGRSIFDNVGNTYAKIIDIDTNDNTVFSATTPYGIYRAYKHKIYEEKTKNYLDLDFQLINNNQNSNLEKIKTNTIFDSLSNAIANPYYFNVTTNTLSINVIFDRTEVVDVYFVSEDNYTYLMHYKKSGESVPSVINLNLSGNYAVYLKINDVVYDTGKILSF